MDERLKTNLRRQSFWQRAAYMLVFAVILGFAGSLAALLALFQLGALLLTGEPNARLRPVADGLTRYLLQLWRYQTFLTETPPFPFAEWPVSDAGAREHIVLPHG
ncbi:DUF4389 domain-containing protein [Plasticicumulans sp.]|uniref:DUF4389 domain-containing protein n=1 Tax=Plasticicumulans sp. TaxID=2307179 RepID=UPI002C372F0A|nr:DUF4389 domain-containing protein [Plasticicumulans sp.]MBS0600932.1 DUF4389 domain-containing protein [Pseudomonadota bacterium]HMW31245.1 DUF4389 domain-containing protein [Plasticicumulans sp.]HMW43576.1 DUF4389 domain-containing protein [Plasticicumulans sp.]HMX53932.1 DUF4389 domain-containing protein [Plasticicumulans sp.]HMZ11826.1 DUF4389 domain-containing protein [Plasticicumulans sp.]